MIIVLASKSLFNWMYTACLILECDEPKRYLKLKMKKKTEILHTYYEVGEGEFNIKSYNEI